MQLTTGQNFRVSIGSRAAKGRVPCRTLRVTALAVPADYGWVMASVAFTAGVTQWQAINVAKARTECGVKYPTMYASGTDELSNKFNCIQRAHQNTLETLPQQLAMMTLLGLLYPRAAAAQGLLWAVGRIVYTQGYSTGDPAKRAPGGIISGLSYIGLILAVGVVGVRTALAQ